MVEAAGEGEAVTTRKVSELKDFAGKDLLLVAQKRGLEITENVQLDGTSTMLIGLADILAENDIGGIVSAIAGMEKAR